MIKAFKVENGTPKEFVEKVTQALAGRALGKIATLSLSNENILIAFSKLGKSEVTFSLTKTGDGFACTHASEKIAFTHKMLRNEIEAKLSKTLESIGASVQQG